MALSYPLSAPTTIGIEQITFRTKNAVSTNEAPFSYNQQVFQHPGARWEVDVSIPATRRDLAQSWVAMLVGLRGQSGTFLLGDPDHETQIGTATAMTVTGNTDDTTITANSLNGTLKAGDQFQLGNGNNSRLHMVLVDKASGSGTLEIWPPLRADYSAASATLSSPKCVFRLGNNITEWSINSSSAYGISFSAVEDLT